MNIQWYPGHMTKAKRKIAEELKLVDIVIELLDARIPYSSRNPDVDNIVGNKKRIVILNKSDLADEKVNKMWVEYLTKENTKVILADSVKGKGLKEVINAAKYLMKDKVDRLKEKGMMVKTIRALIIGIPNVGKSTFINKIAGRSAAETGDRPGVTRSKQWVKISPDLELLDTPGILWPKFEDQRVGLNLAFTGAIKDEILDIEELSVKLIEILKMKYPHSFKNRYKLSEEDILHPAHIILETIGRKRGCMISGGLIDLHRTSTILLDEFRAGKLGGISLESPEDINTEGYI